MINKIPNPEEKHIAGNQCKKLTSAKKRTEKQVNGDIQAALNKIANNKQKMQEMQEKIKHNINKSSAKENMKVTG